MVNTSELDYNTLKKQYKTTSNYKIRFRLLILLHYSQGRSGPEIAKLLFISHDQVYYWLHRYLDSGIKGLEDKKRPGRPPKVNYDELKQVLQGSPRDIGLDQERWDVQTVSTYLKTKQRVEISEKYIYDVLDKVGFEVKQKEVKRDLPDLRTREGKILTSLHIEVMGNAEMLLDAPIHRIITDQGIRPVFSVVDSTSRSTTIQGNTEHGVLTIKYEEFLDNSI